MFPTCSQLWEQLGGICLGSSLGQHVSACENKQSIWNSRRKTCLFYWLNSLCVFFRHRCLSIWLRKKTQPTAMGSSELLLEAPASLPRSFYPGFNLREEQIQVQRVLTTNIRTTARSRVIYKLMLPVFMLTAPSFCQST